MRKTLSFHRLISKGNKKKAIYHYNHNYITLYYITLYDIILYYIVLYYIIFYYIIITLNYIILYVYM